MTVGELIDALAEVEDKEMEVRVFYETVAYADVESVEIVEEPQEPPRFGIICVGG